MHQYFFALSLCMPLMGHATPQQNIAQIHATYNPQCHAAIETFKKILPNLALSERYRLMNKLALDLNKDHQKDYILILDVANQLQSEQCLYTDVHNHDYQFVTVISEGHSWKINLNHQLLSEMDYVYIEDLLPTPNGFKLLLSYGQGNPAYVENDFKLINGQFYLTKIIRNQTEYKQIIHSYPHQKKYRIDQFKLFSFY